MILIIGYGNSLRQDDGGGLELAQQIEQTGRELGLPVERICLQQLVPELAVDIARPDVEAVIFADTRIVTPDDAAPELEIAPLANRSSSPGVGHHLLPEVLLIYAYRLYGQQPPAWLITVPGIDFDHGESLSQITQNALTGAKDKIKNLLTAQFLPVPA